MNVIWHDDGLIDRRARESVGDCRQLVLNLGLGIPEKQNSAIV